MTTTSTPLGKVYLVGAGPGAVDLITVRGAKLLAKADVVLYDALVNPEMLALCPQAEKMAVGKRCGKLSSAQAFINKRLIDAAHKHQTVVRLKGGDPMLFSRADEEITALKQAGIAVEVVPGITAALAGAASLQKSLTLRGVSRSVAFATLAQATGNTNPLSETSETTQLIVNPSADTLVYYMGRKDAVKIAKQLIDTHSNYSSNTPVYILEAISTKHERHWSSTLGELAKGASNEWFDKSSPALIMVGQALGATKEKTQTLDSPSPEIDNRLQNSRVFANSRRRA